MFAKNLRALSSLALCISTLLALSSCVTSQNAESSGITETRAGGIISSGLRSFEDLYYRDIKSADLVATGLAKVQSSYPEIHFTMQNGETTAFLDDRPLSRFEHGENRGDAHYWGRKIAAVLSDIANADTAVDLESLTDSFMQGIVESLHERTAYIPMNRTLRDWNTRKKGDGALGVEIKSQRSGWVVEQIFNIPLRNAGTLREEDIIVEIDGHPVGESNQKTVRDLLSGPVGSPVTLTLHRQQNSEPISLTLNRVQRGSGTVAISRNDQSTRIEVSHFSESTAKDLRVAVSKLVSEGDLARSGLILDLRNNKGGLLEAAVEVAQLFLDQAEIAEVHGRHPDSHQYFSAEVGGQLAGAPVVVLVNAVTASGAEIVASALQDADRAIVIGEVTYGAGTVQVSQIFSSQAFGMIPWGEVTTPSGYRLDKRGVMPTVCTGGSATADAVRAELDSGRGTIDRATRTRDIDPEDAEAIEAFRALCPPRSGDTDISLEVAQAILADPALYDALLAGNRQETAALH